MTDIEFTDWLNDEVAEARMTPFQRNDLLQQKALFDANADTVRREFVNLVVGYVAGVQRSHSDLQMLLMNVKAEFPNRLIYFEPIGFDLF